MREVIFLRHGVTSWNREGRIQGRRDVALDASGRAELARWKVPACWHDAQWQVSPLQRARESAEILGGAQAATHELLLEMDWGDWEGKRLAELRATLGEDMARNEARGLDFRPAGGESPREVRERLARWVEGLAPSGAPVLAMTHKGVIRAALSLATGWDMKADFRPKPEWRGAQVFRRHGSGRLVLDRVNVPLEPVDG